MGCRQGPKLHCERSKPTHVAHSTSKGVLFEDVALRTEVMESTTLSADVMESITPITEVREDRCFEVLVSLNPTSTSKQYFLI